MRYLIWFVKNITIYFCLASNVAYTDVVASLSTEFCLSVWLVGSKLAYLVLYCIVQGHNAMHGWCVIRGTARSGNCFQRRCCTAPHRTALCHVALRYCQWLATLVQTPLLVVLHLERRLTLALMCTTVSVITHCSVSVCVHETNIDRCVNVWILLRKTLAAVTRWLQTRILNVPVLLGHGRRPNEHIY